jgi:hypothetical protein
MKQGWLDWWIDLWRGADNENHVHVFDSENGVERYGLINVLTCRCGAGRVFSGKVTK